jgi:hypothetical protein
MISPATAFEERLKEIDAYLDLLDALERQVKIGPPKIGGAPITVQQQKILYSSVYLQLYNLVEATVTWCIDAITAATADGRWKPADLSGELRSEWIRVTARTHVDLNYENRLAASVDLCDRFINVLPVLAWSFAKGGGGNWDDIEIEEIAERIGFELKSRIPSAAYSGVKRHIRDDKGALALIKHLRNKLSHGNMSFEECGDGATVSELRDIKDKSATFLREVALAFEQFIAAHEFLEPARRPLPGGPA